MDFRAFVTRPIMATAIHLALLIIGLVSFYQLELRHYPKETKNEYQIRTLYPGANFAVVEQRVTKPLEDLLSGLDGIKKISSESWDGRSEIKVKFNAKTDGTQALSQLRDKVFSGITILPEAVKRPEVFEEAEQNSNLGYLIVDDNTRSLAEVTDYVRRYIEPRLRLIDGISDFYRFGDKPYVVTVVVDPSRLLENRVSLEEMIAALKKEKAFAVGGEIEKSGGKQTVILKSPIDTYKDFRHVTVKYLDGKPITVGDVATVQITEKKSFLRIRYNGEDKLALSISVKPRANPMEVANNLQKFCDELTQSLPKGMNIKFNDKTIAFKTSIKALNHTLWEAVILVGIVITLSLASFRAALLPIITVPLCLIDAFAFMWLLGFSINPITLLALVLAVGLVVDDAIVVVENIHRHMQKGLSALEAALQSMKEITFAVIVMTITLAAVYIPLAFQLDDSSAIFKEFAWTLAGSVIISGFVALTLTPALAGKFLKDAKEAHIWDILNVFYEKYLLKALQHPKKVCVMGLLVALIGVWGFSRLPSEYMPKEDEDILWGNVNVSNVVPYALQDTWFNEIEGILQTIPERKEIYTGQYNEWLWWTLFLKPRADRDKSAFQIQTELEEKFKKIIGPKVVVGMDNGSGMSNDEPLKVILQHSGDYPKLLESAKNLKEAIEKVPGVMAVFSMQLWEKPRLQLTLDRDLAHELGVNVTSAEETLFTFLSGTKTSDYTFQGFDYEVEVKAPLDIRSQFNAMNQFFVVGGANQWIPLGSLVDVKEVQEPSHILHRDRIRATDLQVILDPSMTLGKTMTTLEPIIQKHLPKDGRFRFGGKAERYKEARMSMWLTFGLALVFIYLVLAALFESFIHPLVVLLTVPLSMAGAIYAVRLSGGSSNVYTLVGLVTLVGLISKHGILIVDFANRLRDAGKPILIAVTEAAQSRLRPILMTTLAMLFGAVPLVYSIGAGASARHHIGWVIIGGMLSGTLFSLFVVPVVYSLIEKSGRRY